MAFPDKNYTLGKGRVYFDKFVPGTKTPTGQRYIGNTPDLSLTSSSDSLDHFDSDGGIRQKDLTVLLQLSRTGSFVTDHISPSNLALFFLGDASVVAVTASGPTVFPVTNVVLGNRYQIGTSTSAPAGVRNVSSVSVMVAASAKTLNVDYSLDAASGGIVPLVGGSITAGATMDVTYSLLATSNNRVVSAASATIEGALMYVANNPVGANFDYFWPDVTLKPDGDFTIKAEEWQKLGFTFEALKKDDLTEVVYINGRAGVGI